MEDSREAASFDFGAGRPKEEEKAFRKAIGLPVKKELVYFDREGRRRGVARIDVVSRGSVTGLFSLDVTSADGFAHRICSEYFAEMQKPSFGKAV